MKLTKNQLRQIRMNVEGVEDKTDAQIQEMIDMEDAIQAELEAEVKRQQGK